MEKNKHFMCIVYFYLDLGRGSIWFYLELTLNLISYNFYKSYHQSSAPLIFAKIKIYSIDTLKFIKPYIFFIKTFKNKPIQKSKSINHQHYGK